MAGLPNYLTRVLSSVGSRTGAVIRRPWLRLYPPFRAYRALPSLGRNSVSSPRRIKRSMRFSRTTLSCQLHLKGYVTYLTGDALALDHETNRY